ncbi:bifunctional diaminohydroxyphosphoribosylaminopyrimidine deaminase/5-amino-6-(5-phosphoribosylamino)uracil reductase RibD [bacterium]|nr:MAG: bifunctional diaminohydroxyphosphoribosylaminopyrimidine deaminase/5-amino-6-(5-phosphoribosylamino)uracil reductase RibD [bacterium]
MSRRADELYMGLALELAKKGVGKTSPNPAVGAVIARDGAVVGRGYHRFPGGPHAEIEALRGAGEKARGADMYVTLEPCSHFGKTPPCADAIIAAGIKRVVAAIEDQNPLVAGSGLQKLRSAGLEVETGVLREEAGRLNEGFFLSVTKKRAFVHLKLAATLDGKIATSAGDSKWVSSKESRRLVHLLRKRCGAVMVGAGTANRDDPKLTVRLPESEEEETLRAVIDSRLEVSPSLRMFGEGRAGNTLVFCAPDADKKLEEALAAKGARVFRAGTGGAMDLRAVLEKIYSLGRMEVLLEGGARTAREFLAAGLVDRCHFFYSPRMLGGEGVPMFSGEGPKLMSAAVGLSEVEVSRAGEDLYVTGRIGE